MLSTVGSWILGLGILIIVVNLLRPRKATPEELKNPWNGRTLEWRIESPPTLENFAEIPEVNHGPYDLTKD
jgi:cytochrome c oxidase subunit 1